MSDPPLDPLKKTMAHRDRVQARKHQQRMFVVAIAAVLVTALIAIANWFR